ncbi:protease inhibitor I9 family protein [Anaeromyxobacter oryzae]|uniref:Inhibitor I9 domain-containing protein n=1 Tax=Anaeromyxobacter oryzae TaxID=2918170 RepID=A0ABN6MS98_9BACT|nr:protease inhibitor I9 family protein [Anaeromyxobacter oryzae]BDG03816.1 hypothetical protein AMOR_28120 [Anaeromyxobacter oryzae]
MTRNALLSLIVAAGVALGCGGSSPSRVDQPQTAYACGPGGTQPPAKLIVPTSGGVSGRWIVILNADVRDLHAVATLLAAEYGGHILSEWGIINGFAMSLDDSRAPALSEEPTVCYVEQDQLVSVD